MKNIVITLNKSSVIDLYILLKKEVLLPDNLLRLTKEVEDYLYSNLTLGEIENIG